MTKSGKQKQREASQRKEDFINRVLTHLRDHGPQDYNKLFVHFDTRRTAEVGPVLQEILHSELAIKNEKGDLQITNVGLSRLTRH